MPFETVKVKGIKRVAESLLAMYNKMVAHRSLNKRTSLRSNIANSPLPFQSYLFFIFDSSFARRAVERSGWSKADLKAPAKISKWLSSSGF